MQLLFGKPIAQEITKRLKEAILKEEQKPGLAVVLVGNDRASEIYVNLKEKFAKEIGVNFWRFNFSAQASQDDIVQKIKTLNGDKDVHGIIVQLPLPEGLDVTEIMAAISGDKDADGFSKSSANLSPVFPQAIIKLLENSGQSIEKKKALVVANSQFFGEAMLKMLKKKEILCEYILIQELEEMTEKIKEADIVISAVGVPGFIKGKMLKDGVIVIDGGIDKVGEKIMGDVDASSVEEKDGFLSPVPGGVGPVTIACLFENVYLAFKAQIKAKQD